VCSSFFYYQKTICWEVYYAAQQLETHKNIVHKPTNEIVTKEYLFKEYQEMHFQSHGELFLDVEALPAANRMMQTKLASCVLFI
jgi:hypothetical protein